MAEDEAPNPRLLGRVLAAMASCDAERVAAALAGIESLPECQTPVLSAVADAAREQLQQLHARQDAREVVTAAVVRRDLVGLGLYVEEYRGVLPDAETTMLQHVLVVLEELNLARSEAEDAGGACDELRQRLAAQSERAAARTAGLRRAVDDGMLSNRLLQSELMKVHFQLERRDAELAVLGRVRERECVVASARCGEYARAKAALEAVAERLERALVMAESGGGGGGEDDERRRIDERLAVLRAELQQHDAALERLAAMAEPAAVLASVTAAAAAEGSNGRRRAGTLPRNPSTGRIPSLPAVVNGDAAEPPAPSPTVAGGADGGGGGGGDDTGDDAEDDDVAQWIVALGLSRRYASVFALYDMSLDDVAELSEQDLVDLGVTLEGDRRVFARGILQLRQELLARALAEAAGDGDDGDGDGDGDAVGGGGSDDVGGGGGGGVGVVLSGMLAKRGDRFGKAWKERSVTLKDTRELVYADRGKVKGVIDLRRVTSVVTVTAPERYLRQYTHCFDVVTPERVYRFASQTTAEFERWMSALIAHIGED